MRAVQAGYVAKTILLLATIVLFSVSDAHFAATPGKGHRPVKRHHAAIIHFHAIEAKRHSHSTLKRSVTDLPPSHEVDTLVDNPGRRYGKEGVNNGTTTDSQGKVLDDSTVNVDEQRTKSPEQSSDETADSEQKNLSSGKGTKSDPEEKQSQYRDAGNTSADTNGVPVAEGDSGNDGQSDSNVNTSSQDVHRNAIANIAGEKTNSTETAATKGSTGEQSPVQAANDASSLSVDGKGKSESAAAQPSSDRGLYNSKQSLDSQHGNMTNNGTVRGDDESTYHTPSKEAMKNGNGGLKTAPKNGDELAAGDAKSKGNGQQVDASADKLDGASNNTDDSTGMEKNDGAEGDALKNISLSSTSTPDLPDDSPNSNTTSPEGDDSTSATTKDQGGDATSTPIKGSSDQAYGDENGSDGTVGSGKESATYGSKQPDDGKIEKGSSGHVYGSSHSFQNGDEGNGALDNSNKTSTIKSTMQNPDISGEATDGGGGGDRKSSKTKNPTEEASNVPIYHTPSLSDVSNSTVPANVSHWSSDSESDYGGSGDGSDSSSPAASVYSDQSNAYGSSDNLPPSSPSSSSVGSSNPEVASNQLSQGAGISSGASTSTATVPDTTNSQSFGESSDVFGQTQGGAATTFSDGAKASSDGSKNDKAFSYANHQKLLLPGHDGNDDGKPTPPSDQGPSPNRTDAATPASHHDTGAKQNGTPAAQVPLSVTVPSVIAPKGGAVEQPADTVCISILFRSTLGWNALASSPDLVAQIFLFMPSIIAESVNVDPENVTTVRLERQTGQNDHLSKRDGASSNSSTGQSLYVADVPTSVGSDLQDKIKDPRSDFYMQPSNPVAKALAVQVDPSHDILQPSIAHAFSSNQAPIQVNQYNNSSGLRKALIGVGCVLAVCIVAFLAQFTYRKIKAKSASRSEKPRVGNNRKYRDTIQTFGSSAHGRLRETWVPSEQEEQQVLHGQLAETWCHPDAHNAQNGLLSMGHYVPEMTHAGGKAVSMRSAREVVDTFAEVMANRASQETERSGGSTGQRNTLLSHLNYPTEDSSVCSDSSRLTESQRIQQEYNEGLQRSAGSSERSHEALTGSAMNHDDVYERPAQYTSSHAFRPSGSPQRAQASKSSIGGTIGRPTMQRNSVLL